MELDPFLDELLSRAVVPKREPKCRVIATHDVTPATGTEVSRIAVDRTGSSAVDCTSAFPPSFRSRPERAEQAFVWRVSFISSLNDQGFALAQTHVFLSRAGWQDSPWLDCGEVSEVLWSEDQPCADLAFRHFHAGVIWCVESVGSDEYRREREKKVTKDLNRSHHCISVLSDLLTLRLDPQSGWRMLSPNAVLHASFGPGFTIATNGQEVILFDTPSLNASSWTITNKANIIGPVTSTSVAVADWDYLKNKQKLRLGGTRFAGKLPQSTKPKQPSKQSLLMQHLMDEIRSL